MELSPDPIIESRRAAPILALIGAVCATALLPSAPGSEPDGCGGASWVSL
jgi:hypothetical protein